jgi:hypothetical protein
MQAGRCVPRVQFFSRVVYVEAAQFSFDISHSDSRSEQSVGAISGVRSRASRALEPVELGFETASTQLRPN